MPNRRKVLISLGGTIAIAGCSGETEGEETDKKEAVFEIVNVLDGITYSDNEQVSVGGTIRNTGEKTGEQNIKYLLESESLENTIKLEPGEEREANYTWEDTSNFEPGEYVYVFETEDDVADGSFTIEQTTEESEENVYDIGERFVIEEDDVAVTVIESDRVQRINDREASGIFQILTIEVENVGKEEVTFRSGDFELEYDGAIAEPDSGVARELEHGFVVSERLNPGLSTKISVGYDIPQDVDPDYLIMTGKPPFPDPYVEYYVRI
jgi:archaellum component FlaG (FlaF/FlaG flagellin family)